MGINRYRDRHGKERLYWRRKGAPSVALDPALSGAALAAEVARLEALYLKPKAAAKAGTLEALIRDYKARSNHWRSLRARTRKDYERVFSWLGPKALALPVAGITPPDVAMARDRARDAHEPKFANQVVTTLKMVFRHGVEIGDCATNPALQIGKATGGTRRANRPCSPAEAVRLIDHAPASLRPVIAIAIYCGIREGDVIALPRNCIKGDWLGFTQGKTRREHESYVTPALRAVLSKIEAHDATTLLVSSSGRPWTADGLRTSWGRYRDKMVETGKIDPGVTFHGLRHTGATILEEAGFEEEQTRHFLGHGPKSVSGHYGRSAKRRKLVTDMALTIEAALAEARGNVVQIGN